MRIPRQNHSGDDRTSPGACISADLPVYAFWPPTQFLCTVRTIREGLQSILLPVNVVLYNSFHSRKLIWVIIQHEALRNPGETESRAPH
ncbi:unnamed protein product [Linum tenue]|uniref:Uncharacterized protein n=1 Tax=Linum tenue TaxID=586396 RepID=A0AAV0RR24_9ROSI|nr:unnamed protein product [Linum tenue]